MNKTTNGLILKMKTAFSAGIAFGAGLLTTGLFAAAAAMNVFAAGDVISAAKINQNFAIAAPEGAVVAFFRTDCPEGWAPADGNNGTPDLRGQFIRGRDDVGSGPAGNDPEGARAVGDVQPDAFQGHWHNVGSGQAPGSHSLAVYYQGGPNANPLPAGSYVTLTATGRVVEPTADASGITPRTANETRPKNVALTYCIRKN